MLPSDPEGSTRRLRMRAFGRTESELDFWEPRDWRFIEQPQQPAPSKWRRFTRVLTRWFQRRSPA